MTQSSTYTHVYYHRSLTIWLRIYDTINVEIFAVLNVCGFSPMKVFAGMLSWCLGEQYLLFNYS